MTTPTNDPKTYRASRRCTVSALPDGTGMLLDLDTKFYFTLNETGMFVWDRLSEGPAGIDDLAATLARRFDVTEARARADLGTLFAELEAEGLVEPL